ncbi:MAG: lysylphosphatidylglycerol synthase transmembrane domain-containing protein [Trueperella sp.]|nr:lysylphosphatidylglycerol synthase transmembrane domain-containing protein [Trueperella sp.]
MAQEVDVKLQTPERTVVLIDGKQKWVRHPADLVSTVLYLLGIVAVTLLAVYANSTLLAVAIDVRSAMNPVLKAILLLPVNALEGLVSIGLPLVILGYFIVNGRWRTLLTAGLSSISAIAITNLMRWGFSEWLPTSPLTKQYLDIFQRQEFIPLVPYLALIAALLSVGLSPKSSRILRNSWWLFLTVVVLSVLQSNQTLYGALITIFVGIMCGKSARWAIGAEPQRSTLLDLVNLTRWAGIDAVQLVRCDADQTDIAAWEITTAVPVGPDIGASYLQRILLRSRRRTTAQLSEDELAEMAEVAEQETTNREARSSVTVLSELDSAAIYAETLEKYEIPGTEVISRNYIATTADGKNYHLLVLDQDREIIGVLESLWNRIWLKTSVRHTESTIEKTAEQISLMLLRTEQTGVKRSTFISLARGQHSIVLVTKAPKYPTLAQVPASSVTDPQIDQLWRIVQRAYSKGISHGNISAETVRIGDGRTEISDWHNGSIMATETSYRIDLAQIVTMLAGKFGVERAVASLKRCVSPAEINSLTPFLQLVLMPSYSRAQFKGRSEFQELRNTMSELTPERPDTAEVEIKRFSLKTIITVSIGVIAVVVLLGSLNMEDLRAALSNAEPIYMVGAFVAGLFTYLGAAITLKAYTPERLPLGETTLIQVAASLITLVAPAGVGPAALNLRFLQKKGIRTAPALATAAIVQLAQFITTVLLLLIIALFSGSLGSIARPSKPIVIAALVAIVVIAVFALVPQLRNWVLKKAQPTIEQVWPRLVWLSTHPRRIAYGLLGSVVMTVSFIACFGLALYSLGYTLPVTTLAFTYLISNSLGSVVPSPGGIGPVEAALTGGLVIAGIPYSVAFSAAILYRLFTFWGRVPLGWVALRIAGKKEII